MLTAEQKTKIIVAALEDIKAVDITIVNTSKRSPLFECMIIACGQSTRQTKALADHVIEKLELEGEKILSTEGEKGGEWVLVDLGDVLVHIMQPAVRAYYNLEELWGATPRTIAAPVK
ncbi:MAG: ribosome silencing factor [Gallionellaceae bacterium]|jgi:ribosome-associated protein